MELIISIAVFTIGLTATFGLALSNYNTSNDNLDKIIATNLAREGIELIRNVRDSNWLRIEANENADPGNPFIAHTWDYGLPTTISQAVNNGYVYIDHSNSFPSTFNCSLGVIKSCIGVANCPNCQLYLDPIDAYYNHDNAVGIITKYFRGIKLNKICTDESLGNPQEIETTNTEANASCAASKPDHIGFLVTSHVQWEDNGNLKFVEITDKIYNWRR